MRTSSSETVAWRPRNSGWGESESRAHHRTPPDRLLQRAGHSLHGFHSNRRDGWFVTARLDKIGSIDFSVAGGSNGLRRMTLAQEHGNRLPAGVVAIACLFAVGALAGGASCLAL